MENVSNKQQEQRKLRFNPATKLPAKSVEEFHYGSLQLPVTQLQSISLFLFK